MLGLNSIRRPASEPAFASFLVVAGGVILGLWAGEGIFALFYGLRDAGGFPPWWHSLFFAVCAIAVAARSEGWVFRVAVGLFGLRYIIALAEATIVGTSYPLTRDLLSVATAVAFVMAGWAAAWPWARIASCIALLVLGPVKYRMLESATGARSVVDAAESGQRATNPTFRITIEASAVGEHHEITEEKQLDLSRFVVSNAILPTDPRKFHDVENERLR